jgi:hypothetical protein
MSGLDPALLIKTITLNGADFSVTKAVETRLMRKLQEQDLNQHTALQYAVNHEGQ